MDTSLPSPRLPAPDPVRVSASLVQGLLGKRWKPAKPSEGHPDTGHHPGSAGDPFSSRRTCSAVSFLSPKPLPPEEARLPDALSPRPGPPGEGAVFPRGHGSLGCAGPGTGTWKLPAARGTFWPPAVLSAVFPECLWGFVFVLVAVYVNRALCSSCSSSRSSQQHLVGTGAHPRPPSTLRILHWGQSPALRPLGLLAWTAGFGEVPPQGRLCHTGCRSTTSVFVHGEGVQGAPGLRGHRSSTPVLGHPSPVCVGVIIRLNFIN